MLSVGVKLLRRMVIWSSFVSESLETMRACCVKPGRILCRVVFTGSWLFWYIMRYSLASVRRKWLSDWMTSLCLGVSLVLL